MLCALDVFWWIETVPDALLQSLLYMCVDNQLALLLNACPSYLTTLYVLPPFVLNMVE